MINPIEIDKRRNISIRIRNRFIDANIDITVEQANNISDMIITIGQNNDISIEYIISNIIGDVSIYSNIDFDGINRMFVDIMNYIVGIKIERLVGVDI